MFKKTADLVAVGTPKSVLFLHPAPSDWDGGGGQNQTLIVISVMGRV